VHTEIEYRRRALSIFLTHIECFTFTLVKRFYRSTLCVRAVFAVVRCLSVRPSVTFVYCIQTAEDIVRLLSQLDSPHFDPERRYLIPIGNPSSGALNTREIGKNAIFN